MADSRVYARPPHGGSISRAAQPVKVGLTTMRSKSCSASVRSHATWCFRRDHSTMASAGAPKAGRGGSEAGTGSCGITRSMVSGGKMT